MTASRVLVIAPFPFPSDRGSPIRARRLAHLARQQGRDVTIVTYHAQLPDAPGVIRGHVPLRIPMTGFTWRKIPCDIDLLCVALRAARRIRPQVIDAHLHEGLFIALLIRAVLPGIRVVYNAHGTLADELVASRVIREGTLPYRLVRRIERALVQRADHVAAQSRHRAEHIAADGVPAGRVTVVPDVPEQQDCSLPVDSTLRAVIARGAKTVALYSGSMAAYQGVDDILQAARRTNDVAYVLFGSPSRHYPQLARQLGVDDKVTFVDPAPFSELPRYLAAADIALAPRTYGGNIPGKVPLYLAAGLPVVGTAVAGVAEVVDAAVGAVVPAQDPGALAQAIQQLADDADGRATQAIAARKRASELFDAAELADALARVYDRHDAAADEVGAA